MKGSEVFPSKWLKAEDIAGQGDLLVTIAEVAMQTLKNPQTRKDEEKPALFFEEDLKPLLINKTNWSLISDIAGSDESNDWRGQKIVLFVMEVESFGDIVQAIRVRKPKPAVAPRAVTAASKPALSHPAPSKQSKRPESPPTSEEQAAMAAADQADGDPKVKPNIDW